MDIHLEHLRSWIGRSVDEEDRVGTTPLRALAATLDERPAAVGTGAALLEGALPGLLVDGEATRWEGAATEEGTLVAKRSAAERAVVLRHHCGVGASIVSDLTHESASCARFVRMATRVNAVSARSSVGSSFSARV